MANKLASSAGKSVSDQQAENSFSLHLLAGGKRKTTEETYLRAVRRLAKYAAEKGMPPVAYLSAEHLREYHADQYRRGLQASAVSVDYRALQQFYKFLVAEGERGDNPMERIPAPKLEQKIQAHYGEDELRLVLKRLPAVSKSWWVLRNRAIILVLFDTGLRGAELCALMRDDVDFRKLGLRVKAPKSDEWRDVFVSPLTMQAVDRYLRSRTDLLPYLFAARDGGRLTTNGLRMMLERTWKDAGLNFKGVHAFRRGFAITFLNAGGDADALQTLAGWKGTDMLRRYTKATETERARKAHARYSPVQGLNLPR